MRADGALLIGPFELKQRAAEKNGEEGDEEGDEGGVSGVLPAELLFALQVIGMDDVDEGPMISIDEIEMLKTTLHARLQKLSPLEEADATAKPHTREWFVGVYRDGQRRLLRAALEEVEAMVGGAGGEEGEEEEEEEEDA